MAQQKPPAPPVSTATRAKNFLLYGFLISIALHLAFGPFVKFTQTHTEEETPQKVTVVHVPTPPPTPPPTPTPKPTPPPTPPPKQTPPPKVNTPAPVQPHIRINTAKTTAHAHTGPVEQTNKYTTGVTNGIPQGVGTAAPVASAPPAPPAPPTPVPTPTPLSCARPNVPASTLHAVEPDMPPMAQQQGVTGVVQVVVSLDATSHVTSTKVQSSPSVLLNQAALSAARQSTFQTEIRNCQAIAADYIFSVEFSAQ